MQIFAIDSFAYTLPKNQSFCEGQAYTVGEGAAKNVTYSWKNLLTGQTSANSYFNFKVEKNLKIEYKEYNSVTKITSIDTLFPLVISKFNGLITGQSTICPDKTYTYSIPFSADVSYKWGIFGQGNIQSISTNKLSVSFSQNSKNSKIRVIVTNVSGCADTFVYPVFVESFPTPTYQKEYKLCVGEDLIIRMPKQDTSCKNCIALSYKWIVNGKIVSQSNFLKYKVSESHKLNLLVYDSITQCSTLDTIDIKAFKWPVYQNIFGQKQPCINGIYNYGVDDNKVNPTDIIKWSVQGGEIIGSSGNSRVIVRWNTTSQGKIRLDIGNEAHCDISNELAVNVLPLPELSLTTQSSICKGQNFSLISKQDAKLTYYYKLPNETGFNVYLQPIEVQQEGWYQVLAKDEVSGCASIDSVLIKIVPHKIIIFEGPNQVCQNTKVSYGFKGRGNQTVYLSSTINQNTYQFNSDSVGITFPTIGKVQMTAAVLNENNCFDTTKFDIVVVKNDIQELIGKQNVYSNTIEVLKLKEISGTKWSVNNPNVTMITQSDSELSYTVNAATSFSISYNGVTKFGCAVYDKIQITSLVSDQNRLVNINYPILKDTYCIGQPLVFSHLVRPNTSISWQVNGVTIPIATSAQFKFKVLVADNSNYQLEYTDDNSLIKTVLFPKNDGKFKLISYYFDAFIGQSLSVQRELYFVPLPSVTIDYFYQQAESNAKFNLKPDDNSIITQQKVLINGVPYLDKDILAPISDYNSRVELELELKNASGCTSIIQRTINIPKLRQARFDSRQFCSEEPTYVQLLDDKEIESRWVIDDTIIQYGKLPVCSFNQPGTHSISRIITDPFFGDVKYSQTVVVTGRPSIGFKDIKQSDNLCKISVNSSSADVRWFLDGIQIGFGEAIEFELPNVNVSHNLVILTENDLGCKTQIDTVLTSKSLTTNLLEWQIVLSPNPSLDHTKIALIGNETVNWTVITGSGQLVLRGVLQAVNASQVLQLPTPGIYYLNCISAAGQQKVYKIVRQ